MKSRSFALLFSVFTLFSCSKDESGTPPQGRPLRIVLSSLVTSLDPQAVHTDSARSIISNIFDGLVAFDFEAKVLPALAVSWSNPSEHTWVFELRRGVRFHDGRLLTAHDVKYTLERNVSDPTWWVASRIPLVASVRVHGEHTVEIETRGPTPLLLNHLTEVMIFPQGSGDSLATQPVGTGPYRVASFVPGTEVVLAAFGEHWRGTPRWPGTVFRADSDGGSRAASVLTGEADLAEAVPVEELSALARSGSAQVLEHPGLLLAFLAFDVKTGPDNPFADPEVRRAVALTIDREELIGEAFGGRARPASQLAPPTVFGYLTGLAPPKPDVEAARAALARSRFRGGFRSRLHFSPHDRRLAELICRATSGVGIELELEELPRKTLGSRIIAGTSPVHLSQFRFPSMDSSDALDAGLHTRSPDGRHGMLNFHNYSDPELDRLLDRSGTELDSRKRFALLEQAMQLGMEARVLVPLCFPDRLYGARRDLRWQGNFLGRIRLEEITEAVE